MAEPTSRLTFADLIMRVARKAGIAYYGANGDEKAMVPIDVFNLELCKDIVNDAIRMFISDAPLRGWRWMRRIMRVELSSVRITGTADDADSTSLTDATLEDTYDADDDLNDYYIYILTGTGAGSFAKITNYTADGGVITVADWLDEYGNAGGTDPATDSTFAITSVETVGGDIAYYPLDEDFGGEVSGKIEYAADTSHAAPIIWCDESEIRSRRSISVNSGYPRRAAIIPLEPAISDLQGGSAKRRFALFLDPEPSSGDILEFPYNLTFDKLDLEAGKATAGTGADNLTDSARTEADDYFNGWKIEIISGTGKGSWALVSDYTSDSGKFDIVADDWLKPDGTTGGTHPAANSIYVVTPVNNAHPAGARFDESILAACMARLEMDSDELQEGLEQRYLQKAIPLAHKIDARSAPRTLGSMNDGLVYRHERTWGTITTDHDV